MNHDTGWLKAGDAAIAARMLALDDGTLGGVLVMGPPGSARDEWVQWLRTNVASVAPWRRVPGHVADERLLGGLDVAATLAAGRPVVSRGLLAEADGGCLVLPMVERLPHGHAASIAAALDRGEVVLEREGLTERCPTRFRVVALDEHGPDDAPPPRTLGERLAIWLDPAQDPGDGPAGPVAEDVEAARRDLLERRRQVIIGDAHLEALCAAAAALGIDSLRAPMLAVAVARTAAAMDGRLEVGDDDVALAVRLVLAPRLQTVPDLSGEPDPPPETDREDQAPDDPPADAPDPAHGEMPDEVLVEAARAVLPEGLLSRLRDESIRRQSATIGSGANQGDGTRGRPIGHRAGIPGGGRRLELLATLKAAAPWQRIRGATPGERIRVRADDLRIVRRRQRRERITVFVVDASGSSAAQRLAEVKGAVELLLADCYVRRDQVALIAFRGSEARTLLAPTRALARARRELAGLPGGGGTPLAAGIDAARQLAASLARRGQEPVIVLLTDGRANVALDGAGGRERAHQDSIATARRVRADGLRAMLIDTSARPRPVGREVATEMGALYLPLPRADAGALSGAVRAAGGS